MNDKATKILDREVENHNIRECYDAASHSLTPDEWEHFIYALNILCERRRMDKSFMGINAEESPVPPEEFSWHLISSLPEYIFNTGKRAFFGCVKADFYTPENDAHIMGTAYEKDGRYYLMVWQGDDIEFSPTHWRPLPAAPATPEGEVSSHASSAFSP